MMVNDHVNYKLKKRRQSNPVEISVLKIINCSGWLLSVAHVPKKLKAQNNRRLNFEQQQSIKLRAWGESDDRVLPI